MQNIWCMEQWKQIEGKDNAEVSTWGRIRVYGAIKDCKLDKKFLIKALQT